jgi:dTDP-4-dehydrorhamnose reductase
MRIAVIGSRGQLGGALVEELESHHDVTGFDRAALDVTDDGAVSRTLTALRPDVVINATGFNAVDAAEERTVEALRVNGFAVRAMARACSATAATLVHYGTDFVFDGRIGRPLTEEDPPNPRSAYAISKLLGEWFARDAPRWYVLRVESLFGTAVRGGPSKGTVAGIVNGLVAGNTVKVFSDRTVSPTYVIDASRLTRALVERNAPSGIYHCVNSGQATWLEFATEAARLLGITPRFDIVRFADVKLPAERPQYCAMSNAKLAAATAMTIPAWQDALDRYVRSGRPSGRPVSGAPGGPPLRTLIDQVADQLSDRQT